MSSVRANPSYIRRFFTGRRSSQMHWNFSVNKNYATIDNYEQFLFVHNTEAESEDFKHHSSIKGTRLLVEHQMDNEVKEYLSRNMHKPEKIDINQYRVYTFFKKFGAGKASVENDCLRFAESLAIGKYPYRGSRSFMKDNITENLIGESYERNFQIANEILYLKNSVDKSPYNNLTINNEINENANPDIGQCYGILSLWSPKHHRSMPYHFACVLFKDKDDTTQNLSNITVEANVGDQSLQMPQFHIYDVGNNTKNYSFYDTWNDSFLSTEAPIFKINIEKDILPSGETVIRKIPPPPSPENDDEYYDAWGFLAKGGNYKLRQGNFNSITVVTVLKNTKLNPEVTIIPKPYEHESVTPKSPSLSPIKSPRKHPFILHSSSNKTTRRRRKPNKIITEARARRVAETTRRRRESRAANIHTARQQQDT